MPLLLLLAVLLPLLATGSLAQPGPVDESCAPATCGNLEIKYPFWLHGQHPSYCGYPTFGVTCDDPTGAKPPSLNDTYLRILDISYGNNSVLAFHASLADGDACRGTRFNVSSTFSLSPLAVSSMNWELLLFNSSRPEPPPPAAGPIQVNCSGSGTWSVYPVRGHEMPPALPAGCQYSVVPVLPGSELRTLGDYAEIVRRGFLLEWTVPGDCPACKATGGECRYETGVNAFGCRCPDGRMHPATCGQFSSLTPPHTIACNFCR